MSSCRTIWICDHCGGEHIKEVHADACCGLPVKLERSTFVDLEVGNEDIGRICDDFLAALKDSQSSEKIDTSDVLEDILKTVYGNPIISWLNKNDSDYLWGGIN